MAIPTEFTGTFGCGHEGTVSLANVPKEKRLARIDWLKREGKCSACFARGNEQQRKRDAREAARWAVEQGLPALAGSPNQIDWAEQIRQDTLISAYRDLVETGEISEAEYQSAVDDKARKITSAKFWIELDIADSRDLSAGLDASEEVGSELWARERGLVRLVGSEKQVAFAQKVRVRLLKKAENDLVPSRMSASEFDAAVLAKARAINVAGWWLDQKDATTDVVIELIEDPGHSAFLDNVDEEA